MQTRPSSILIALAAAVLGLVQPLSADELPAKEPQLELSVARHFTDNAFSAPYAFEDWYTTLRGTITRRAEIGRVELESALSASAKRFDTYGIEDDHAIAASLAATTLVSERVRLRGALSWKIEDEGDDLLVADRIIGIRTLTRNLRADLQAGVELDGGYAILVEAGLERNAPRATRFEADIVEPLRLFPRKDRIELGAKFGRTAGRLTFAASAGTGIVIAGREADAPITFDLALHRLALEANWTGESGIALSGAAGAAYLRGLDGALSQLRPTYRLAAELPLIHGASLRATISAAFDTRNNDDPVASWYERREIELGLPVHEHARIALGAYDSWRGYLLLGGGEKARGAFAEVEYRISSPVSLLVRIDRSRSLYSFDQSEVNKWDAFVGLRARM